MPVQKETNELQAHSKGHPQIKSPQDYNRLCQSDAFKQDAFTQTELRLQVASTLISGSIIFYFTQYSLDIGGISLGNSPYCLGLWISCLLIVIASKYMLYYTAGYFMGMRPLTAYEDFWLYDLPVNPYGIPTIMVFNKTEVDPTEMYESILKKVRYDTHCDLKMVKMFGKYFFKPLSEQEYQVWRQKNTGILTDVDTDQKVMDFMLKLKQLPCKSFTENVVRIYYLPSINNGTESAIITYGHHCMQDGQSAMQAYYRVSDAPETSEYPFIRKPTPSFLQWAFIYLTIPFGLYQVIKWYYQRGHDVNCIKPHEEYMSGKPVAAKTKDISVAKTKEFCKKHGATINDLILAVITKVMKKHFNSKGDKTDQITLAMPYTFNVIPKNPRDYVFYNNFTSLTLFVKLTENFTEALKNAQEQMKYLKNSFIPYALMVVIQMYNTICPQQHAIKVNKNGGKKHSLVYSNVPGYVKPVKYGGQVAKRFFYVASAAGTMSTAITMVSILKRLTITLTSDEFRMSKEDVDLFIKNLNQELDEMGLLYDELVEGQD